MLGTFMLTSVQKFFDAVCPSEANIRFFIPTMDRSPPGSAGSDPPALALQVDITRRKDKVQQTVQE